MTAQRAHAVGTRGLYPRHAHTVGTRGLYWPAAVAGGIVEIARGAQALFMSPSRVGHMLTAAKQAALMTAERVALFLSPSKQARAVEEPDRLNLAEGEGFQALAITESRTAQSATSSKQARPVSESRGADFISGTKQAQALEEELRAHHE